MLVVYRSDRDRAEGLWTVEQKSWQPRVRKGTARRHGMNDEIRRRIDELHEHLEAGDDTEDLKNAVRAYDDDGDHEALADRLREGALRFESSHPELSGVLARIIDSLTAAGI
jgi:hypothetical protein